MKRPLLSLARDVCVLSGIVLPGLLVACSQGGESISVPNPVEARTATVTVQRADIENVLTLNAIVIGPAEFTVTAPAEGEVLEFRDRAITFASVDGIQHVIAAPDRAMYLRLLAPQGTRIPANYPIAEARFEGFALRADVEGPTVYRLYSPPVAVRGQIKQGPGPFPCPMLQRTATVEDLLAGRLRNQETPITDVRAPESGEGGGFTLLCAVPIGVDVLNGMGAVMALTTEAANQVLTLPVEAVAGSARSGSVVVETPTGAEERDVELGITDGTRIEIVSGLEEGDVVRIPAPDLRGASDAGG